MNTAYFDDDGVCVRMVSGPGSTAEGNLFAHSAEVPVGTKMDEIWFDAEADEVKPSVPMELVLPDNPTAPFNVDLPPGVIAEVRGVRFTGAVTIDPAVTSAIELMGAARGRALYRNYAERRQDAYPPIGDQLDALWKAIDPPPGSEAEAMKAAVEAVKARIPKT